MNEIAILLKAGFLGFAAAIVYYSFKLLDDVVKDNKTPPAVISKRTTEIRIFMLMSILVIVIGLIFEFMNPKIDILLTLAPRDIMERDDSGLYVSHEGKPIDPTKGITVSKYRNGLFFDLTSIDNKLTKHTQEIEGLKNQVMELKQAQQIQAGITKQVLDADTGIE